MTFSKNINNDDNNRTQLIILDILNFQVKDISEELIEAGYNYQVRLTYFFFKYFLLKKSRLFSPTKKNPLFATILEKKNLEICIQENGTNE